MCPFNVFNTQEVVYCGNAQIIAFIYGLIEYLYLCSHLILIFIINAFNKYEDIIN